MLSCHTHNLQESLKSRQVVAKSLLCILGVEIFVPISLYEYIISICYPLSFIRKVENIAIIYKVFLPVEEHTRLLVLIRKCQCPSIRNDLSSRRPITWSAWDWVKRQPPLLYIRARNADVHHNLNVSNPVPKVYTIYDTADLKYCTKDCTALNLCADLHIIQFQSSWHVLISA